MSHGSDNHVLAGLIEQATHPHDLLQTLIDIQHCFGHVPEAALQRLEQRLGLAPGQARETLSFYHFLDTRPRAWRILFSDNITDRMDGSLALRERLQQQLGEHDDVEIGVTSCIGLCDQGPSLLINGRAMPRLDARLVDTIAERIRSGLPLEHWPEQDFGIEQDYGLRDRQLDLLFEPGASLHATSGTDMIALLDASGLRGRGGAGFPTGRKWRSCRDAAGEAVVICNADEGEPGTFKDRVLLAREADRVIEGMTLCARAVGAREGWIYLRGEYAYLLRPLQSVLERRREAGLLGESILGAAGFDFDIRIRLGAGAYICGEESALIESLEGRRGRPRIRPPFPVQQGFLGRPTVVNNVETFFSAANVALMGAAWFREAGTEASKGTRLLSISGDCARPGVYEFPFGIRIDDILHRCGAEPDAEVQMAGAAGHRLVGSDLQRRLCFDDCATGGSFMVFDRERELFERLENFAEFFRRESCGFCTPCRAGSEQLPMLIRQFARGRGSPAARERLQSLLDVMRTASFCGLGSSAPTVFLDALRQSPERFAGGDRGQPAFDLDAELDWSLSP